MDEEANHDSGDGDAPEPDDAIVDAAWAVVIATNDEQAALAVHKRLLAGNIDAYVRDLDDQSRQPDEPSIQVIVPVEQAAAAVLELELHLNVREAQSDPGRVDRLAELGFAVDDLEIAELTATDGPVYELDELGDDDDVRAFLSLLGAERIRFTLDRQVNLIVHYNDEAKVDELIERLFAYDDDLEDDDPDEDGDGAAIDQEPTVYDLADVGSEDEIRDFLDLLELEGVEFALDRDGDLVVDSVNELRVDVLIERSFGPDKPFDAEPVIVVQSTPEPVIVVHGAPEVVGREEPDAAAPREPEIVGPTVGLGDFDGRPVVDDVTPEQTVITESSTSPWIFAVVVLVVVVVLIILVL